MREPTKSEIKYWKQCYHTPKDFFDWVEASVLPRHGCRRFSLDACAEPWNAMCGRYLAPEGTAPCDGIVGIDGLKTDWKTLQNDSAVWCNPGFSNVWPWMKKARESEDAGQLSCVLTHAAHACDWAQWTIGHASACWLINPRINFDQDPRYLAYLESKGERPAGNNRDSMLWVFDPAHEGPCEFINPAAWRERKRKKAA